MGEEDGEDKEVKQQRAGWATAQLVEPLHSMWRALGSVPSLDQKKKKKKRKEGRLGGRAENGFMSEVL